MPLERAPHEKTLLAVPQKESFLAALLEKYSMQQNPSQRVLALWEHLPYGNILLPDSWTESPIVPTLA